MHVSDLEWQQEDVPRREPEAPPEGVADPRVRALLQAQQGAGNQAVARMLARTQARLIQRQDSDDESEAEAESESEEQAPATKEVDCDGTTVDRSGRMPSWEMGGKRYHVNLLPGDYHITEEGRDASKRKANLTKTHYFFEPILKVSRGKNVWEMKNAIGTGGVSGSKKKFSDLPTSVQKWFTKWYEVVTVTVK